MSATPRELVYQTLRREGPARAPRELWRIPWVNLHHPEALERNLRDFPDDILHVEQHLKIPAPVVGDPYTPGRYVDEWGCTFINIQAGLIGQVKEALVEDWAADRHKIHIPREWLSVDVDAVNRDCDAAEQFMIAGCCPRPFEQLQFLRGITGFYMDLLAPTRAMLDFMREMHQFHCEQVELWARQTHVDGFKFMDDWGSQRNLLIQPELWREYFKPMYRDFIQIIHAHGKQAFMHSDGQILAIYPDLIEIGVDALNSQLFCMGLENLEPFAGKITFWGEIDRQWLLPRGSREDIRNAVAEVHRRLWRNGACIALCEFTAGSKPENVYEVYAAWNDITMKD